MVRRREILDSDDDGSDFGDGVDFENAEAFGQAEEGPRDEPQENPHASRNGSTDSTDQSFFQRIYNEQQAAADGQDAIPDTAPAGPPASAWTEISSAPPPGQKPQTKDYSSLTPITDPVPASRRPKKGQQADVIDFTDITTPGKEAASGTSDAWDIPSSTRPQRAARTYGKRKDPEQQLSPQEVTQDMPPTQDPYAFPDSTPPARKKARRGATSSSAQQPPESSPILLVPTGESISSETRPRSSRKKNSSSDVGSSIPDTAPPSLYIAQSTLTASQKQEYRIVSLSSDAGQEVPEQSLPAHQFETGEMYRSSCATTIAYPTPSRITSSRRLADVVEEVETTGFVTAEPGLDVYHQQSSPDVLTEMSATNIGSMTRSRRRVVSSAGPASSELDPPTSTRRARKRKVVQVEDHWEQNPFDTAELHNDTPQQDAYNAEELIDALVRPEPGLVEEETPAVTEREPVEAGPMEKPGPPPKPAAKGRRGRKKKGSKSEEPQPEPSEAAHPVELAPEPAAPVEASAKRKRGRARRAEIAKPQPGEPQEQEQSAAEVHTEVENVTDPEPLSELPRNSQPTSPPQRHASPNPRDNGNGQDGGASKENDLPAVEKPATKEVKAKALEQKPAKGSILGQPGKVQYRVGLSRMSRIAPLLKSLKKPV
ncbi:hypothetical protein VTI74DRAFT_7751 [Chaetomium olivicolor]